MSSAGIRNKQRVRIKRGEWREEIMKQDKRLLGKPGEN